MLLKIFFKLNDFMILFLKKIFFSSLNKISSARMKHRFATALQGSGAASDIEA